MSRRPRLDARERVIAKSPRIYICTATVPVLVTGTGPGAASKLLAGGAQVDFDEVIGVGPDGPVTLEEALGAYTQFFRPARQTAPPLSPQGEE